MRLLSEGQTVGKYYIDRFLGEGAFAEVYRVKHRVMGTQAMKVFKAIGMTGTETDQLLAEARLLSALSHPNIIRVFDADEFETAQGTCVFFTMEYMPGGSLEDFWRSYGPRLVPIDVSIDIICQVCRGLAVAHSQTPPIIHRDIKPQNILVGYDGPSRSVRLSDFGLAKHVNPLTLLASVRGTPSFKAPEAMRNWQGDSSASDVWALGATLYLLLTDRLPFSQPGEYDHVDERRFDSPLIPPSKLNIQADGKLDYIVARSLALKPRDRYQTASEMLADLAAWKPQTAGAAANKPLDGHSDSFKSDFRPGFADAAALAAPMVSEAISLATRGRLKEAADLMEQAFKHSAEIRERYEYRVLAWRSGKVM